MEIHADLNWLVTLLPESELRTRLERVRTQISQLNAVSEALEAALEAHRLAAREGAGDAALSGSFASSTEVEAASDANGKRPGTTEAVRRVLAAAPRQTMTVRQLYAELEKRDWLPQTSDPRKALGATLTRMRHRTQEVKYLGDATYRLAPTDAPNLLAPNGAQDDEPVGTVLGARDKGSVEGPVRQA